MQSCVFVCMYVCMYVRMFACVSKYVCVYVRVGQVWHGPPPPVPVINVSPKRERPTVRGGGHLFQTRVSRNLPFFLLFVSLPRPFSYRCLTFARAWLCFEGEVGSQVVSFVLLMRTSCLELTELMLAGATILSVCVCVCVCVCLSVSVCVCVCVCVCVFLNCNLN
jgi:hypothetical protein